MVRSTTFLLPTVYSWEVSPYQKVLLSEIGSSLANLPRDIHCEWQSKCFPTVKANDWKIDVVHLVIRPSNKPSIVNIEIAILSMEQMFKIDFFFSTAQQFYFPVTGDGWIRPLDLNGDGRYDDLINCIWQIAGPEETAIELEIHFLQTEGLYPFCESDNLYVSSSYIFLFIFPPFLPPPPDVSRRRP